jgi:hypothetical protein
VSILMSGIQSASAQRSGHYRSSLSASITASPVSITPGQKSTLSWTTQSATSVTLNGAAVATSGSTTVAPTQSTSYVLVANNAWSSKTATTTVSVTAAPTLSATIAASPTSITAGQKSTITWNTQSATSVTLNGAAVATSGSTTVAPTQNTSYVLVANNGSSSKTATTAVSVTAAPSNPSSGSSTTGAPHINYTDLNVGSGTGGDNGNGVYVRIFGSHFGASQGSSTATLGGYLVTNCSLCSWSDNVIVAQLGSAAKTGNIVVTANGLTSNGVPFTVTPTTIVFVSPKGLDSNDGSFTSPFKTWRAAYNSVTSRDSASPSQNTVIYLEPGTDVSNDDGRGYNAAISTDIGGTSPTSQISIVGYPGGTVNVGSTGISNGVKGWGRNITIANLTIVGQSSAIDAEAGNMRIINNSLSCPAPTAGLGGTACVLAETENAADTWVFDGNNVHDTGGKVDKTYHAVYFSSGANHADVGWNNIGQNFKGYCRSIMFHATTGSNQYDLHVHDNIITGGYCDGIQLASVNPSQGTVEIYNNVVSHVATAANPYGVANEAGIAINSDPAGTTSGTVQVYNNTVVDAGAYTTGNQNGCFGVVYAGAGINLTNNICVQPSSAQPYIEPKSQGVTGTNNLWSGAGAAPSFDPRPVTSLPSFVSAINFALQSISAGKSAGTSSKTSPVDIIGNQRGTVPSVGAYQ